MSLDLLKSDPMSATQRCTFRTGPAAGSFALSNEGGLCKITCTKLADDIFDLKATAGAGTDYFYPWLQRGYGWVKVPKDAPNGTVVMTGGVNGCTLIVSESAGFYYFYHDGDSCNLPASAIVGTQVAKVQPKDYDPLRRGEQMFKDALAEMARAGKKPVGDISYGHFVVAVKKGGKFGFYVTGLMSMNGLTRLPYAITPCIVTFGDD